MSGWNIGAEEWFDEPPLVAHPEAIDALDELVCEALVLPGASTRHAPPDSGSPSRPRGSAPASQPPSSSPPGAEFVPVERPTAASGFVMTPASPTPPEPALATGSQSAAGFIEASSRHAAPMPSSPPQPAPVVVDEDDEPDALSSAASGELSSSTSGELSSSTSGELSSSTSGELSSSTSGELSSSTSGELASSTSGELSGSAGSWSPPALSIDSPAEPRRTPSVRINAITGPEPEPEPEPEPAPAPEPEPEPEPEPLDVQLESTAVPEAVPQAVGDFADQTQPISLLDPTRDGLEVRIEPSQGESPVTHAAFPTELPPTRPAEDVEEAPSESESNVAGKPPGSSRGRIELDSEDLEDGATPITASAVGVFIPALTASRTAPPDSIDDLDLDELDADDLVEEEHAAPAAPPPLAATHKKGWYDEVFRDHFLAIQPKDGDKSAVRDVEFILGSVKLAPGATVLDVGCGTGRHAAAFADRGLDVTGLDNSLDMLLDSSRRNEGRENSINFLHADMRDLALDETYDLVACLGSTFGYFDDETNAAVLERFRKSIAPGGRLVIHVFNRDFMVPRLPTRSWWEGERCMVMDEAEMNHFANRLRVHRTIVFEDGRQFEHYMFLKAFTLHDLGKAMSAAGLRVLEVAGSRDTRNRFFGSFSPDIWLIAEVR